MFTSPAMLLGALAAVGLALCLATVSIWRASPRLLRIELTLASLSLALHTLSLALFALKEGRAPLAGQHAGLSFTSWALLAGFLILQWRSPVRSLGAFLLPLVAGLDLAALLQIESAPTRIPRGQHMQWLALHASLSFLGLAAFGVVFCLSVMYLLQERSLKSRSAGRLARALPSLDRCDRYIYRALSIGFPLLTLGIFSGIVWMAAHSEEGAPALAKILFPVLAWALYAIILWARIMAGIRGRKLAWAAILGFLLSMLTFLGI